MESTGDTKVMTPDKVQTVDLAKEITSPRDDGEHNFEIQRISFDVLTKRIYRVSVEDKERMQENLKDNEEGIRAQLDDIKKMKEKIDKAIFDIRSKRNGDAVPMIRDAELSEQVRNSALALPEEIITKKDDSRNTQICDENANEIFLPTNMLNGLSKKEKKEIEKLEKANKQEQMKLQQLQEKNAKKYQKLTESQKIAEEKEMSISLQYNILQEIRLARKEQNRTEKLLKKERKEIERKEKRDRKNLKKNKKMTQSMSSRDRTNEAEASHNQTEPPESSHEMLSESPHQQIANGKKRNLSDRMRGLFSFSCMGKRRSSEP